MGYEMSKMKGKRPDVSVKAKGEEKKEAMKKKPMAAAKKTMSKKKM